MLTSVAHFEKHTGMKIAERVQQNESMEGCVVKLQYVALEVAEVENSVDIYINFSRVHFSILTFQSVKHKYITLNLSDICTHDLTDFLTMCALVACITYLTLSGTGQGIFFPNKNKGL